MNLTGLVKWWNDSKGYGFITARGEDYYAHYTGINTPGFKTLREGALVQFDVLSDPNKSKQAVNIVQKETS
jgi:CspA family cold shock protein